MTGFVSVHSMVFDDSLTCEPRQGEAVLLVTVALSLDSVWTSRG